MQLKVHTSKSYDVVIAKDVLRKVGNHLSWLYSPCKICVVTDENVDRLYSETVMSSLKDSGFDVYKFVFKPGEESKTFAVMSELLSFLIKNHFNRDDKLLALGGGVVGDLTGFTAATYKRGIGYSQVPTTLLAAADSSTGGKTAINLPEGKNLLGAFWQPDIVICDTETFTTLSDRDYSCGMAEIIKMGVLFDKALLNKIKLLDFDNRNMSKDLLTEIVFRAVELKACVVEQDEKEQGTRKSLNFGHTIGHAIELVSGFSFTHGEAVAIGMMTTLRACYTMGLIEDSLSAGLKELLMAQHLPVSCDLPPAELAKAAMTDKKISGNKIDLVLPLDSGMYCIKELELENLEKFISLGIYG